MYPSRSETAPDSVVNTMLTSDRRPNAVAFGIVDFSTVAPTTALSTVIFGRRSAGTVFGLVALSHQIGSALGSYAGGLVHDLTGSYAGFILAGAALSGAAAFMSWAISESPAPVREAAPA